MKQRNKFISALAAGLFLTVGAAPSTSMAQSGGEATIFAFHASPDAPGVDIFVGDTEIAGNLDYGNITSGIRVAPGSYNLDFFAAEAGTTRPNSSPVASQSTPSLQSGESYLLVAGGLLSPGSGERGFTLIPLEEGFTEDSTNRLRFVHAAPDVPAVNLGIVEGDQVSEVATNLTFSNSTPATGVQTTQSPAVVTVAPTSDPSNYLRQFTINLQQGGDSTIFAILSGVLEPDGNQKTLAMHLINPVTEGEWNVSLKGAEAPDIPGQTTTEDTTPPPQDDTVADDTDELAATGTDTAVALSIAFVLSLGALLVVKRKSA
jgi:hypothetical protein